jgi:hypothetical protein
MITKKEFKQCCHIENISAIVDGFNIEYITRTLILKLCKTNKINTIKTICETVNKYTGLLPSDITNLALHSNNNKLAVFFNYDDSACIRWSCRNGHIDLVKYLLETDSIFIITTRNNYCFRFACYNKHYDLATYLMDKFPEINIRDCDEHAFRLVCCNNNFEFAKKLYDIDPTINIGVFKLYCFKKVCENDNVDFAKWIYDKVAPNVRINLIKLFKKCCESKSNSILLWLYCDLNVLGNNLTNSIEPEYLAYFVKILPTNILIDKINPILLTEEICDIAYFKNKLNYKYMNEDLVSTNVYIDYLIYND